MEFVFECVGCFGAEQFISDTLVVCSSAGMCEQPDSGARIIFQRGAGVNYGGGGGLAGLSGGDCESLGGDSGADMGAPAYLRLSNLNLNYPFCKQI